MSSPRYMREPAQIVILSYGALRVEVAHADGAASSLPVKWKNGGKSASVATTRPFDRVAPRVFAAELELGVAALVDDARAERDDVRSAADAAAEIARGPHAAVRAELEVALVARRLRRRIRRRRGSGDAVPRGGALAARRVHRANRASRPPAGASRPRERPESPARRAARRGVTRESSVGTGAFGGGALAGAGGACATAPNETSEVATRGATKKSERWRRRATDHRISMPVGTGHLKVTQGCVTHCARRKKGVRRSPNRRRGPVSTTPR